MNIFKKKDLTKRIGFIDELRGALIILVVLYHAVYLFYNTMPVLMPEWLELLQPLVYVGAGLFIFLSGVSCNFTENNFRRGIICFGIACAITVISLVYDGGSTPILWGVLHLIGFSIILFDLFRKLLKKTKTAWALPIFALLFVLTFRVKDGFIGIPYILEYQFVDYSFAYGMPQFLFPLGIIYKGFNSADYYPLLPWLFLFVCGTYVGRYLTFDRAPAFFKKTRVRPLAFIGRHTLWVYVLHVPVLIGIYKLVALILY